LNNPHPTTPPAEPDYVARVNRAIDLVIANLDCPLHLDRLARAANFSPFHFHRIFQGLVGETPGQFVKRVRLERALRIMSHDPKRPLTHVALDCGFSSSSDFSRVFKQRFGASPRAFDLDRWRAEKHDGLKRLVEDQGLDLHVHQLPKGANPDGFAIELVDLPPRSMAYIRVHDPYREGVVASAAQRLVAWAERAGVAEHNWYGYMWDEPEVVELKDCRYDVAVEADNFEPSGEVGRFDFPAMRVARLTIRGGLDLEMRALDWLYRTWLPESGYVPDDQPCFEAWIARPFAHGMQHFELDIHLPVRASHWG
tara:strand:- start:1233 stop:2165 length:933 start_codon:yes stop_codon:yes gene_type:complete